MTYREYDQSPVMQFARFVLRTFPIGTAFGVEVRMYWAALLLMPMVFASWVAPVTGGTFETIVLAGIQFLGLFAVIWTHEMGHIAMGWRHGIRTDLITLSPLGGLAHMNSPATTPGTELRIALAGPAVHLVWLAVTAPLWWLLPKDLLQPTGWVWSPLEFALWFLVTTNVSLLLFNLLPIFPLDGGRSARALLSMRWHPNRATLWATTAGMVGGGVLILLALSRQGVESSIGVLIGVLCIQACLHERRKARHALIYDANLRRELWETDPDAWKRASSAVARDHLQKQKRPKGPGVFARWAAERAARRAEQARAADAALDREVDTILERVHEVGMTGLSEREKAVLRRASQRRRGAG